MAKQVGYVDTDLMDPHPKRAGGDHGWHVTLGISLFVASYALLHKLFIPLALQFTSLHFSVEAHVDPWCWPVLLWWLWLIRKPTRVGWTGSLFAGLFIAHGIFESYRVFAGGADSGWLAFSHLLSSWPLALCGVALLLAAERAAHVITAVGTAFTTLTVVLLVFGGELSRTPPVTLDNISAVLPASPTSADVNCGAQSLALKGVPTMPSTTITAETCGLFPTALQLSVGARVTLVNHRERALNFHFYSGQGQRLGHGWNVLVAPGGTVQSPPMQLGTNEVGVVFSDADASVGLTAVVNERSFARSGLWQFARAPLRVEWRP